MKKYIRNRIVVAGSVLLTSVLLVGCADTFGGSDFLSKENMEKTVNDAVDKAADKVAGHIKAAVKKELKEFFGTDELVAGLGLTDADMGRIQSTVQNYVENYEFDEESLQAAKASVESVMQNAQGLTVEEIQQKLADAFENNGDS